MEILLETALKSQNILGGIHFLIFLFSWPFVIGYLKNYHDQFRFTFNCLPKPSDYTRQHCYDRYVSSLSPLLTPLDISGITFGVLGFFWVCFIITGGWLKRRIGKEQVKRRKKRQTKTFLLTFTCHVCFQFVVLLLMMVLFCGFQTLEFPASYWCTQGNITLSPTKQVLASNMTCKDAWYKEKSKLNKSIIAIMSLSIFLCLLTMLQLLVTRRAFLEHLLGNITSPDEEQSMGLVAGFPDGCIPASVVECGQAAFPTAYEDDLGSGAEGLCGQQSFYGGVKKGSGGNEKGESDVQSLQGSRKQKTSGSTFDLGEAKKEKTNGDSTREQLAENEGTCTGENAERIKGLGKMQKIHKDSTREMFSENERTCAVENAERIKGTDKNKQSSVLTCDSSPPQLSIKLPKPSDIHSTLVYWSEVELPIDVILLTAEEWEFLSCFAYLDASPLKSYSKEIGFVYFGSMGGGDQGKLKIALLQCSRGTAVPSGSLATVKNAVRVLGPRAVFSVGACSGLSPERAKLGDVVVSSKLTTPAHRTPVSRNMGYLIKDMKYGWVAPLENRSDLEVRVHCDGDILSQELAARFGWRVEDIMRQHPEATAVETDGEGVFAAAYDDNVEWIIVKGVASYGDLSQSSMKDWELFASTMAASLVAYVLKDDAVFREWRHASQGEAKKEKTNEDSTREKLAENEETFTGENAERIKDAFCPAELIEQIRQTYRTREGWLAPFPWCVGKFFFHLDDIFTRLKMVSREKTRGTKTDKVVEMSAIFQPHEDCHNPRSVLIEGKPGMGKTTYCSKISYDWATKKPEEGNCFEKFQVVLFLRCRDIDSNLEDAIVNKILPVDFQEQEPDKFLEFIKHIKSNVLLVLDGLDELSKDKLPEFEAIIEGRSRIFGQCPLVVTARPEAGIAVRKSFDTLLEIEGFTLLDAIHFISKFFKKKGENLALKLILKVKRDKNLQELIANPLNTSLLCLLCEDLHGLFPENRTQLYVDIVECVLRRYKERKGLPLATCDDLMEEYKPQLLHLGWIALNGLHEDKTFFEKKHLANHASDLSEMGFLSVQPGSSTRRPCRDYAFLHKSFQELFAAYYLCCQLISHEISPDTLVADDRYFSELRQVLLFTCGMLAELSPEITMALIKGLTARINIKGSERKILVVLECIKECKIEESNFHVGLAHAFGSGLTLRKLHLPFENLGDTEAAALADALRTNTTLTKLYLSNNYPWKTEAKASFLDYLLALHVVTVSSPTDNLRETGAAALADALADALRTNTTLTELNLSKNHLGETGAAALFDALRTNTTLTELNLSDTKLGKTGAAVLADALRTNTTLTKLDLSGNNLGKTGAAVLADALRTDTTLTELNLSVNNLGETGAAVLADALRTNTTLAELNLSVNNLGETGAAALADALRTNTTLTELNLSKNHLGETGAAVLADALRTNTTLTELDLSGNNLRETGASVLADALRTNTTLTELGLSDNELGWTGAGLFDALFFEVAFSGNNVALSGNNVGETGAAVLADALRTNTTLTELGLFATKVGETGAAVLADALRTNTTLTELDLSGNNLGETGAAALADALRTNTTLTQLDLSATKLGETGAAALADALRTNTTLTELNLSKNHLGETGAAVLADALRSNTTLTKLYLSDTKLGKTGAAALVDALCTNTTLTELDLSNNELSLFVAKEIQKVHGDRMGCR